MKRIARQLIYPTALAVAAALLSFIVLASATPVRAAAPEQGMAASKADRRASTSSSLSTSGKGVPQSVDAQRLLGRRRFEARSARRFFRCRAFLAELWLKYTQSMEAA